MRQYTTLTDRIKAEVTCRELFDRVHPGTEWNECGDHVKTRAPWRDDRDPSVVVYHDQARGFNDYGGDAGGSVIDLGKALWGVDSSDATRRIAELFGLRASENNNKAQKKALPTEIRLQQWQRALIDDDDRLRWWNEHRCVSTATLTELQIGWDGERYSVPVRNGSGELLDVRRYDPGAGERGKVISWARGHGGDRLYPFPANTGDRSVVLCEGEGDYAALRELGIPALTRTTGAGTNWKQKHSDALKAAGVEEVTLAFDHDDSGRSGTEKCGRALTEAGFAVRVLQWSADRRDKWDVTDEIREHGADSLRKLLDSATEWETATKTVEGERTPTLPGMFPLTDMGNAERFAALNGRDVRYCDPWNRWLIWDHQRWQRDETRTVDTRAKTTVRNVYQEAANCTDDTTRKALADHAKRSESDQRLRAMLSLARSEPGIPVLPDELDRDPWLLNCANGTVDLRTGELRKHERADLHTKLVPVNYNPEATCPLWDTFLRQIMGETADSNEQHRERVDSLVTFLQRAVGYSLTGDTREDVLIVLHGTGSNGKSTFLELLKDLLADYAMQTPASTFLAKRSDQIPNDVARLKGARFVCAIETDEGRRLAEAMVKQMTGGDTLTARFMKAEWFEFRPEFKVWLASNHRPTIRGTDHAIWRRIRLVPFDVRFVNPKEDPDAKGTGPTADASLPDTLRTELPGILAWAVRGCLDWQKHGLGTPEPVREATAGYRADMDVVAGFLEERCVLEPTCEVFANELYRAYSEWCEESGERPESQRKFGARLTERGIERERSTGGKWCLFGIGLLQSTE